MKPSRILVFTFLTLGLSLPALASAGPGPGPDQDQKQAKQQLKTALKDMLKEQKQDQLQAMDSFKACLESLRDDVEGGVPPEELLEPLRDCVATFVEHVALSELDCARHVMQQAGNAMGKYGGTPDGFGSGEGSHLDKGIDKLRKRTRKRIDQGLHLLDKTVTMEFERQDYELCVRAIVPDLDFMIPVEDGVIEDLRPIPLVAVMVAGSCMSVEDDGLLFASGYSFDPAWEPDAEAPAALDFVQLQTRVGLATLPDVPLYGLSDDPLGEENPPIRWFVGFSELDDSVVADLAAGALPEGNVLVRAVQNGVVGTATILLP